jgi:hypothetical protein
LGLPQSTVRDTLKRAMAKLAKDKILRGLLDSVKYGEHQRDAQSAVLRMNRSLRSGAE